MDLFAHLEAYVAVTEERSFSKAAELLHLAQPVLSRRIKMLEKHFGGELFDRSRRQITSTDLGLLLLPHARDVLSRANHLRQVARTALAAAVHSLGVPPDCAPAALARVIRAGADRGVRIGVRELPAQARATELADGSLTYALLRVPPETANLAVPLGLASAEPLTRSVHLESLRPRRGAATEPPPILLMTEDEIGFASDRFRRAASRAGLPEARVRTSVSTAAAVIETLAGHALLVCDGPFARRHDLSWSPLADVTLHRGYEVATGHPKVVPGWLEPLLAEAVGAVPAGRPPVVDTPDPRARLAASG